MSELRYQTDGPRRVPITLPPLPAVRWVSANPERPAPPTPKPLKAKYRFEVHDSLEDGKAVLTHYKLLAKRRRSVPKIVWPVQKPFNTVTTIKGRAWDYCYRYGFGFDVQRARVAPANAKCSAIIEAVARAAKIKPADIVSERRSVYIIGPRHVTAWMMSEAMGMSTTRIGRRLGDRDHSTIVNSLAAVRGNPKKFQRLVDDACEILGWPRMVIGGPQHDNP